MNTMIISGVVTALAAVTTLVSGAIFKRAFDAQHQAGEARSEAESAKIEPRAAPQDHWRQASPTPVESAEPPKQAQNAVQAEVGTVQLEVGTVKSANQEGGVTAGYVGSVSQTPPEQ